MDPLSVKLGVELSKNESLRALVRAAGLRRRTQLLAQVEDFFQEADRHVTEQGAPAGLVVILDNLEQVEGDAATRQAAIDTSLHEIDALRSPPVHLIYTVPPHLVYSKVGPVLGRVYSGEPLALPMVKVRDQVTGRAHDAGLAAMRSMLDRRLPLDEVFAPEAVEILVDRSGGYPRELLRLAREAMAAAPALPVREPHALEALEAGRLSYQRGLTPEDFPLLRHVRERRPEIQEIPGRLRERLVDAIRGQYVMLYPTAPPRRPPGR